MPARSMRCSQRASCLLAAPVEPLVFVTEPARMLWQLPLTQTPLEQSTTPRAGLKLDSLGF